jgi:uncharacterized protein (DUF427 family)
MAKAIWEGAVLAESQETVIIEGNHYFPSESLNRSFFRPSNHTSVCSWKGTAGYCDVVADGETNRDAALILSGSRSSGLRNQGPCGILEGCKGT